jgi:hypothetical protein
MTTGPRDRAPVADGVGHAAFHARGNPSGIGAAVVEYAFEDGRHVWNTVVSDGREWRYVRVLGEQLAPFQKIPPAELERGIERFAETLPADYPLQRLLDANPLHVDRDGNVSD